MSADINPTSLPVIEKGEVFYRRFAWICVRLATVLTKREWRGSEKIPPTGGVLIVSNHISYFDPVALGHFLLSAAHRWPRIVGKAELWKVPVIGFFARKTGQIPVERDSDKARDLVGALSQAMTDGKCVCIYPEGTLTVDPDYWPMVGRTGSARVALLTGCPVIPVGQWGSQKVMPGQDATLPRLLPRKKMQILVGDPVELDDLRGQEITHELLVEAAERIQSAITVLVAELREQDPPKTRYDMRSEKRVECSYGR
ncbi:MAG: lysophospholipid acyltransferase family protein [Propionibacteriaceae bacterium]